MNGQQRLFLTATTLTFIFIPITADFQLVMLFIFIQLKNKCLPHIQEIRKQYGRQIQDSTQQESQQCRSHSEALKTNRNIKTHVELLRSLGHPLQSLDISVVPVWLRNSSNTAESTTVSCRDKRFRGLGGVRGRIVGTVGDGRDRIWREEGKN